MEKLAVIQENLSLLMTHQEENLASGQEIIDMEIQVIRIGNFVLVMFQCELSVQIGLNIKKMSPLHNTFVAGFSNGYIYYAPTVDQYNSEIQEDSDCLLAT